MFTTKAGLILPSPLSMLLTGLPKEGGAKMGILGTPNFLRLLQKGDIEGFEKALKDKDPHVREMAIKGLAVIASGGAYPKAPVVREKACWAISKARSSKVKTLACALKQQRISGSCINVVSYPRS